jgi:hypothetical protein
LPAPSRAIFGLVAWPTLVVDMICASSHAFAAETPGTVAFASASFDVEEIFAAASTAASRRRPRRRARLALGDAEAALETLTEADAFWREFDAENHFAGEAAFWLARAYADLGRTR